MSDFRRYGFGTEQDRLFVVIDGDLWETDKTTGKRLHRWVRSDALRTALDTEPLFDPDDRITAMDGSRREPRTPADYVEAYRNRLIEAVPEQKTDNKTDNPSDRA